MHRAAIVPDDQIALRPAMGMDELRLRGELCQVAQEDTALRGRPSDDMRGVAAEIKRRPAGARMTACHALLNRWPGCNLLGREVVEAKLGARIEQRVLGQQLARHRLYL